MLKRDQVDELEKLIGQLQAIHAELSALAKKSPADGVNPFKLQFINRTLKSCNELLGKKYKPFEEFEDFNADDVPSNSDVTFIISQYMQATEKIRADNIHQEDYDENWYYTVSGGGKSIQTGPPAKIQD
jgi:hypothetical protein